MRHRGGIRTWDLRHSLYLNLRQCLRPLGHHGRSPKKPVLTIQNLDVSGFRILTVFGSVLNSQNAIIRPIFFQTSFTVRLESFDTAKKVTLIKEIKNLVEGMNLVQAKKFVESCPTVVKADLSKDEADKLKEALTSAGAVCKIE